MKVYILVEGKETEKIFYPALFKHYKPAYKHSDKLDDLCENSYYIQ